VECRALILLLHSPKNLLAASSFDNVLQKIGESKDLPFKILDKDIDERQVGEGCVKKDGYWQWNFLIREDASVCEYKYVIDKENHVTQFRRVLIEGPQAIPQFGGNAGSETMSTKAQEHYASFCKCVDFLIAAARKQDK
jgi:hypothetical protein